MKTYLFRVKCLTDLHVGNGEANYSIIDNEVQKDSVLQDVPIISASGVKGALKEHFEGLWGIGDNKVLNVFGGDKDSHGNKLKDAQGKAITKEGKYKFFTALCLARPLRVTDGKEPYVLCTGEDTLKSFSSFLNGLGMQDFYSFTETIPEKGFGSNVAGIEIEGQPSAQLISKGLENVMGEKYAVAKSLEDFSLPVRARNALDENGQSNSLWYEELVPHKSIFFFAVMVPDGEDSSDFRDALTKEGVSVQFGGNASIGNGYTTITEVYPV